MLKQLSELHYLRMMFLLPIALYQTIRVKAHKFVVDASNTNELKDNIQAIERKYSSGTYVIYSSETLRLFLAYMALTPEIVEVFPIRGPKKIINATVFKANAGVSMSAMLNVLAGEGRSRLMFAEALKGIDTAASRDIQLRNVATATNLTSDKHLRDIQMSEIMLNPEDTARFTTFNDSEKLRIRAATIKYKMEQGLISTTKYQHLLSSEDIDKHHEEAMRRSVEYLSKLNLLGTVAKQSAEIVKFADTPVNPVVLKIVKDELATRLKNKETSISTAYFKYVDYKEMVASYSAITGKRLDPHVEYKNRTMMFRRSEMRAIEAAKAEDPTTNFKYDEDTKRILFL